MSRYRCVRCHNTTEQDEDEPKQCQKIRWTGIVLYSRHGQERRVVNDDLVLCGGRLIPEEEYAKVYLPMSKV